MSEGHDLEGNLLFIVFCFTFWILYHVCILPKIIENVFVL